MSGNPALERILASLQGVTTDMDVGAGLQAIVGSASSFFDVAGAGLMLIGERQGLQAVVASDEPGQALEDAQERLGEGPCVDALVYDAIVTTEDLAVDERYRTLAPEVVPLGVRAVLGMPVHVSGAPAGTLNVYASTPRQWQADVSEALLSFAKLVGTTLSTAVTAHRGHTIVTQLEHALTNRVTIERATGVLMARRGVDAVTAFNILRERARSSRRKVADIADDVLSEFGGSDGRRRP
jgi:GAF domain-containing protein